MILGTYHYKTYTYSGARPELFAAHKMRVEVLKATQRKYYVRYMGLHANGAAVNSLHWVKQSKVFLDDPAAIVPRETQPAAPREVGDIRLPYKD